MNKTIHLLSEQTINQIAAGEVIENPASVVKELVENGIDAGSTSITVEILGGGFQSIKVSDNGCGMGKEDVELSIERHTTSKIVHSEDLWTLSTMGFRGEALASIASISQMEILTSLDGHRAVRLKVEGGKKISSHVDSRPQGTSIEVKSLFYNTPARKAFQKSVVASQAEITKTLTHLALAHPRVGFTLIQQKKEVFSCSPHPTTPLSEILQERSCLLLHREFAESCTSFSFGEEEVQGFGLLGSPKTARQNRSGQYLFINNRPVHSLSLSFAVQEGYGTTLSTHSHPLYLLHLFIPSAEIDVNVHPQKKEVRLHRESVVRYALKTAVRAHLGQPERVQESLPYNLSFPSFSETPFPSPFSPALFTKEEIETPYQIPLRLEFSLQPIALYQHYLLVHAESLPLAMPSGIVFFDLKRCRSRLLMSEWQNGTKSLTSQRLLLPLTLTFSLQEIEKLLPKLSWLHSCGIEVEQGGKYTLLVSAIPPYLPEQEIHSLLLDLTEEKREDKEVLLRQLAQRISAAPWSYTLEGGVELVKKLFQTEDPHHCPKGRATYFFIKEADLEKRFAPETPNSKAASQAFF